MILAPLQYRDGAMIYQKISTELLTRLDYICLQPQAILVYGYDTDATIKSLKKRYLEVSIQTAHQLQDLVSLENQFDFIYAALPSFPKKDPDIIFHFFYRALKTDGLLLFFSFGPDTDAHATACACEKGGVCACEGEGNFAFFDMHHIGDWVLAAGFSDPVMDREVVVIEKSPPTPLFQRGELMNPISPTPDLQRGESTSEVIYGHGWKVRDMERKSDEYFVSVDNIKKNK